MDYLMIFALVVLIAGLLIPIFRWIWTLQSALRMVRRVDLQRVAVRRQSGLRPRSRLSDWR
jgi:hypothetical protein